MRDKERGLNTEMMVSGMIPDEPSRGGETSPIIGSLSSVPRTRLYIWRNDIERMEMRTIFFTLRNKSLGRCGNTPHFAIQSYSSSFEDEDEDESLSLSVRFVRVLMLRE
jgi:hypothetical protein